MAQSEKIKLIVTDVDGVLTDGCVFIDVHGNEMKKICYRDLDAIGIGRRAGYEFAFATGENTEMVDRLAARFGITMVYANAKDKLATIKKIAGDMGVDTKDLIYVGDSDRDAPAFPVVGLAVAPIDATRAARNAANKITESAAGTGVLFEVVTKLVNGEYVF